MRLGTAAFMGGHVNPGPRIGSKSHVDFAYT